MTAQSAVVETFERAWRKILTRAFAFGDARGVAVAFSGGLDSSVLLHLAAAQAKAEGIALFAFHVHHGISANADAWLAHCESEAARLAVAFDARRVQLDGRPVGGIEEAARMRRYHALGEMCRAHGASLLLTAHHQDDQAETLLLQLLRGSGVAGLCGMDAANVAPDLFGDSGLLMARPLLAVSRPALAKFAQACGIVCVDDESNADTRYTRNALRHRITPAIELIFPGFQERLARSSMHMQAAQRLLDELAQRDLADCREYDCLRADRLAKLNEDRIDNLLRYWLGTQGVRMPSTSWLHELRSQLLDAREDARLCVTHAEGEVRRYQGGVYFTRKSKAAPDPGACVRFSWSGETQTLFSEFGGVLHFIPAEQGVDAHWLRAQQLQIRHRQGGERLKPAPNRSTRSLKHHYQYLQVPPWERERLPVVWAGEQLLYAGGIGMDCHCFSETDSEKITLRWEELP